MKRMLFGLVAAVALVVVPLGAAETSYTDPAGDSGTAPDVTAVTVSNTNAGVVTFRVAAPLAPDTALLAMLNTDADQSTGTDGIDRAIVVGMPGGSVIGLVLDANNQLLGPLDPAPVVSGGVIQFSFAKDSLGVGEILPFWLRTISLVEGNEDYDDAPDGNFVWVYMLTQPAPPAPPAVVKPVIGKPAAQPVRPTAGKRFTVTFAVTRSDDGEPLTTGVAACTTKVAGKVVAHRHTFKSGTLRATLVVPKTARGKLLNVSVKVKAGAQVATKVVTYRIR